MLTWCYHVDLVQLKRRENRRGTATEARENQKKTEKTVTHAARCVRDSLQAISK